MQVSWKLRLLRWYYAKVGWWVPGLAGYTLQWLFTPQRRRLNATHQVVLRQAQPFTLAIGAADCPGAALGPLVGYRWGGAGRVVLLVHGWDGMAADFYKLTLPLVAQGYQVVALDLPAHGASPGRPATVQAMVQGIQAYVRAHGAPYALVAHSFGGLAAATFLAQSPALVEVFVFIGSPVTARYTLEANFDRLRISQALRPRFYGRLAKQLGTAVETFAFEPAQALRARHLLAIYDVDDELVTFTEPADYLRRNPVITCLLVAGVGHQQLVRQPAILSALLAFLNGPACHVAGGRAAEQPATASS